MSNLEDFPMIEDQQEDQQESSQEDYQEDSQEVSDDGFQLVRRNRGRPNRRDILQQVASGDVKPEDADKLLRARQPPRFVVKGNGSIALYNLHRYPIILYVDQWEKIERLMKLDIFSKFVDRNSDKIARRFPSRNVSNNMSNNVSNNESSN